MNEAMRWCTIVVLVAAVAAAVVPQHTEEMQPQYSKGYPYPHPATQHPIPNLFPFDSSCPNHCTGHGECVDGKCVCDESFSGDDCSTANCPMRCHGHGHCHEGLCVCRNGWIGDLCQISTCPNQCSGNGRCFEGDCFCERNWIGVDCGTPKYGIPNVPKPRSEGYPENVVLNGSCVVVRVPALLKEGGPSVSRVNVTVALNKTCLFALGEPYTSGWTAGTLLPLRTLSFGAGDHIVCDAVEGCSSVAVDVYYGDSLFPVSFINGKGVLPSPAPSPLPRQVKPEWCGPEKCSGRGVCMNYTVEMAHYSCVCEAPWIPPCCCSKDRNDSRPSAIDPLALEPGSIEFNHVPCSHDDGCAACSEVFVSGDWVALESVQLSYAALAPNSHVTPGSQCTWDAQRSQCGALMLVGTPAHNMPCRNPGIPDPAPLVPEFIEPSAVPDTSVAPSVEPSTLSNTTARM